MDFHPLEVKKSTSFTYHICTKLAIFPSKPRINTNPLPYRLPLRVHQRRTPQSQILEPHINATILIQVFHNPVIY